MEADKARLMDRVEQLTGEPMGGVSAPIPLLPATVHINLPAGDGHRKADVELDEKRALASIVRMAYAGGQRAATVRLQSLTVCFKSRTDALCVLLLYHLSPRPAN